ncbi:hypothetical protein, partial [Escherichia coli]|uniref:hypothetical protein n=1 Tax=Escherichia coli TaxID=562 RepID=UPI003CE58A59
SDTDTDADKNKQEDWEVIFEVHDWPLCVGLSMGMILNINQKLPRQKASSGTRTFAGFSFHFYGADDETRTRTAFATTPSR